LLTTLADNVSHYVIGLVTKLGKFTVHLIWE